MNKIKNNIGMTLVEMLAATMIMLLVSIGLASGVALSNKEFVYSIRQSEAQELFSTLQTLISNELRYTYRVWLNSDDSVNHFFSVTYAISDANTNFVSLISDDSGEVNETNEYGELALGSNGQYKRLVGSGNYANGLGAKVTDFKFDPDTNVFTLTLDVGTSEGSIISKTFNVRGLNAEVVTN